MPTEDGDVGYIDDSSDDAEISDYEMSDTGTVTDDYDDTADDWETADESWEDDSDMTDSDFPDEDLVPIEDDTGGRIMILELKGIYKEYQQGKMKVPVLKDNINFSMEEGEYVAIMGPSGSGKTTLMNIIGCLDKPTKGEFFSDGQEIGRCSENDMSDIRLNKIGFVFSEFSPSSFRDSLQRQM